MPAKELIAETFPFLESRDIDLLLGICEQNGLLFYFPEDKQLLGYYRFFPELIHAVADQDFDTLMRCDLTEGPLIYIAALVVPTDGFRTMWRIADRLGARAFAFHRFKKDQWSFHFFRNTRYGRSDATLN